MPTTHIDGDNTIAFRKTLYLWAHSTHVAGSIRKYHDRQDRPSCVDSPDYFYIPEV